MQDTKNDTIVIICIFFYEIIIMSAAFKKRLCLHVVKLKAEA